MRELTSFIKIDRNLLDWRWFGDVNTLGVWMWLLLNANYEPRDIGTRTINRGEVAVNCKIIAEKLSLTEKQVRTAIGHLTKTGEIRKTGQAQTFGIYLIEGFSRYQDKRATSGQPEGNLWATSGQPEGNLRATTKEGKENKEYKEYKKGKNARAREAQEPEAKFNPFEFLDQMIAEEEAKEKAKHEQAGNNASDQVSVGILSHDADEDVERSGRDNG